MWLKCSKEILTLDTHSRCWILKHNLLKFKITHFNSEFNMSTNSMSEACVKTDLKGIFKAGIKAVLPHSIIESKVKIETDKLLVGDKSFPIGHTIHLVGFGKAVMGMAIALERMLGDRLKRGIISVPRGSKEKIWEMEDFSNFPKLSGSIDFRESCTNNQPDAQALETTDDIIDMIEGLKENDTLIVLISGGGSALLYMPRPLLDWKQKQEFCRNLQNAGADITELNTVRKKLSMVKGGGLARMAYPATVISLILSDIVGDPLDLIASGPTVYSPKNTEDVLFILRKYNLIDNLEGDMKTVVMAKEIDDYKNLLNANKQFKHVTNIIVGNNSMALEAASKEALKKGLTPIILRNDVKGLVNDISLAYVEVTNLICLALQKYLKREEFYEKIREHPVLSLSGDKVDEIYDAIKDIDQQGILLIAGGEPTVKVTGKGKGGRNQELALYFSLDWLTRIKQDSRLADYEVIMLSGGTDGQDGPTDAAGAFGYPAIGPIVYDLRKRLKAMYRKEMQQKNSNKLISQSSVFASTADPCKKQESDVASTMEKQVDSTNHEEFALEEMLQGDLLDESGKLIIRSEIMTPLMLRILQLERMIPQNALKNNDTYNFYSRFKKGQDLVKIGLTDTNVMDLHFVYIRKRQCGCDVNLSKDESCPDPLDEHNLDTDISDVAILTKTILKDVEREPEYINLKIIDENLAKPCCSKKRKV